MNKQSSTDMAETQTTQAGNWWDVFPAPRAKCPEMTADELMKAFDDMDLTPEPRSFLLVDVRRNDWEVYDPQMLGMKLCAYVYHAFQGGTIKTSLNLPAQSFYQSRKTLLDLCDRASIKQVIFYCGKS